MLRIITDVIVFRISLECLNDSNRLNKPFLEFFVFLNDMALSQFELLIQFAYFFLMHFFCILSMKSFICKLGH